MGRVWSLVLVFIAAVLTGCETKMAQLPSLPGEHALQFQAQITKTLALKYHLFLPDDYGSDPDRLWPLLLFLHGSGERGADLERVKIHGYNKISAPRPGFPFIMVSPLCPGETRWTNHLEALDTLLSQVMANYAVDADRLYLTGLSMGGAGAWQLAIEYPRRFAALAPICGWGESLLASRLKELPVWVFHGALDTVVPVAESERMVTAINNAGGQARLTIYPDATHDSWTATYANDELYEWFLSHRLGND